MFFTTFRVGDNDWIANATRFFEFSLIYLVFERRERLLEHPRLLLEFNPIGCAFGSNKSILVGTNEAKSSVDSDSDDCYL